MLQRSQLHYLFYYDDGLCWFWQRVYARAVKDRQVLEKKGQKASADDLSLRMPFASLITELFSLE